EETKKPEKPAAEKNEDFNRTVVISKPELRKNCTHPTPLHRIAPRFIRKKQEIEDLIGGSNISRYTNVKPDTSAQLDAPLSNLDTRYSVLEEFAEGGLATVSIARDRNLRRVVAIKSLKEEAEKKPEVVDAFVAEAKVTAQLDHPAIIPIYGLTGDARKGIHLSMKLVNGRTLRDYLRNITLNYRIKGIKTFDEGAQLRKRLEIFLRVCDAIAYAHHRNIIHRDLKPENIMLGEYMEVYVVDWGLAKVIEKEGDTAAEDTKISGTPRYFSPEALRGKKCDARADIFTLGLILQEIVTLQFAVKGRDEKMYMEHIVSGELEPIRHLFKWRIDKPLQSIIRKATAYRVEDRYQTVSDLSDDLRRYMGGFSISAVPENIFTKFSRWSVRYWKEFVAGVLAVLLVFAAITVYAIFRQLKTAREMNVRSRAVNFIYNRTATVSEHLNITALQIQEQLLALARISAYLLSHNTGVGENSWQQAFRPNLSEIGKTEKGMFYSPYYKRLTSLDYGIYTLAPDADRDKCFEFIKKTSPVLRKMKNIVLGSQSGYNFDPKDYEKLKMDYLYHGFPVRSVFIGTSDGLKLLYPWRGNYPREIDPRRRTWYQSALRKRGPVWGKPYMDFDSTAGLSIPCSVPIIDLQEKFRGVVGLDLSVNKLTDRILKKGNTGNYVIEKP
ncbi:MAG: protein kinase, partial [Lentisphaeria bacterium]|nr:protein kinase [Lentisphaeria bacterium]